MEKGEKGVDNLSVTAEMTFSFGPSFSHLRLKVEQDNESIIFIDIVFALLVYPHLLLLHFLFILYRSVDRFRSNLIFKYFYRYEVVLLWKNIHSKWHSNFRSIYGYKCMWYVDLYIWIHNIISERMFSIFSLSEFKEK